MEELVRTGQEANKPAAVVDWKVEDIKKYIAPKATDQELFMFVNIAKSYNLNPFKREIHFIKYGQEAASIVVGYEAYLKRAESTGKMDGWKCWIETDSKGEKAIIQIKRKDWSEPFRWEVYRSEFDRKQSSWNRMPSFMLKKVVIAQGFRLCFPEEMGGLPYIPEEINGEKSENLPKEKVDPVVEDVSDFEPSVDPEKIETISEAQQKRFFAIAKGAGKSNQQIKDYLLGLKIEYSRDIPKSLYEELCSWASQREPGQEG